MTTKLKIIDIVFDTDGDKRLAAKLHKQEVGSIHEIEHEEDEDPNDFIADQVSNATGWCISSIQVEVVA